MPIRVREGNTWKEVANSGAAAGGAGIPGLVTGTYSHYTNRSHNTAYENTTSKLIHVNTTLGINRNQQLGGEDSYGSDIAGSHAIAWIAPNQTAVGNPSNSNTTQVAQVRDNGSWNTEFLFLNTQFFVPVGYWYIIKLYQSDGVSQWFSAVSTFTWSELNFELQ